MNGIHKFSSSRARSEKHDIYILVTIVALALGCEHPSNGTSGPHQTTTDSANDTATDEHIYNDTDTDPDRDTATNSIVDKCPDDPEKTDPGICGCGVSDKDSDGDKLPNCQDVCPLDPQKQELGVCGCGIPDTDSDLDGLADCDDKCPTDPQKTDPGECGCGLSEEICNETDTDSTPDDAEAPAPGSNGAITITAITDHTLTIQWIPASDDNTDQDTLTYLVSQSSSPNIDTVEDAESATVVQPWTANVNETIITGLTPDSTYYFNVVVRDLAGNKALYTMTSQTTCRDLHQLTAFFPFSGNYDDLGPSNILLVPSSSSPMLSDNRNGEPESSYYFNGIEQNYFTNADHPSPLGAQNELTVSVWVKLTGDAADQKIISRAHHDGNYGGWVLGAGNDGGLLIYPEVWDSLGQRYSFTKGVFAPDVWTHLAMTWKTGGKFCGYIDGSMVYQTDASPNPIANVEGSLFRIGARSWMFPKFFVDGNVDDIRIYDWALTETEIVALSNLPAV